MTPSELIAALQAQGVDLTVVDGAIRFRAPVGVMTPAVVAALRAAKPEVMGLLAPKVVLAEPVMPTVIPAPAPSTPTPARPQVPLMQEADQRDPVLKTIPLPGPTAGGTWLFTAGPREAGVVVRVVGAAGGFAALSFDVAELLPNVFSFASPGGQVIIVPSGAADLVVRVKPRMALYAKGSVAGVIVSLSGSDLE